MVFNSVDFAIFFAVVIVLYALVPRRAQNLILLCASYCFYAYWDWRFLGLIFGCALIDYTVVRHIARTEDPKARRRWVTLSIAFNLLVLGTFKYFDFFTSSMASALHGLGFQVSLPTLHLILPLGISFFTFQSMAYTIDIYRRQAVPARTLLDYLVYVSFFPQMVAGPIERPGNLLRQLERPRTLSPRQVYSGSLLFLWGLFKKVAVADNLAVYVNAIYEKPELYGGTTLMAATCLFAFQIYCDFSGYTDMAIGIARVLGIELMPNFRTPYFSQNVQEFWQRWHISLSSWFRDYVYIPLGGSRASEPRVLFNIMAVFLLSGLWHGANWTFVIWGALHGFFVILTRYLPAPLRGPDGPLLARALRILVTFSLVCFAWIFFRAVSVEQAWLIIARMFGQAGSLFLSTVLASGLLALVLMLVVEALKEPISVESWILRRSAWFHLGFTVLLVFVVILFGAEEGAQFIYFQF
jgi:D-alanyl-lipoteichoic acid acyltransferase DltB (MBOAT superfamily)